MPVQGNECQAPEARLSKVELRLRCTRLANEWATRKFRACYVGRSIVRELKSSPADDPIRRERSATVEGERCPSCGARGLLFDDGAELEAAAVFES